MVEKSMLHFAGPVAQQRRTYRKWHANVQEIALDVAAQQNNDVGTLSFLGMLFLKTMGRVICNASVGNRKSVQTACSGSIGQVCISAPHPRLWLILWVV